MYNKLILAMLVLCCPLSQAGELVHSFVNPDFGGSPFNGVPLLANASAQNSFQAKSTSSTTPKTAAQSFQTTLNNQIQNKLVQLIVNQAFPTTDNGITQTLPTGTSTMGNYTLNNDTANNSITVTDSITGTVLITLDLNTLQ